MLKAGILERFCRWYYDGGIYDSYYANIEFGLWLMEEGRWQCNQILSKCAAKYMPLPPFTGRQRPPPNSFCFRVLHELTLHSS